MSLSVEQPIAGDELRAIKRYLATRTDSLPWLFVSERGTQLTRQAVNYLIACIASDAGLPSLSLRSARTCSGTPAATTWPSRSPICASCRISTDVEAFRSGLADLGYT